MPDSFPALRGVLPVFQTPWHDDETLDVETLEREIDWLFGHGADGIVLAMVSEVLRLTPEEISPPPASLAGVGKDDVLGLARRKDRLLILLDMARLLIGSDLSRIDHQGNGGKE